MQNPKVPDTWKFHLHLNDLNVYTDPFRTPKSFLFFRFYHNWLRMCKRKSSDFFSWSTIECDLFGVSRDWKGLRKFACNVIVKAMLIFRAWTLTHAGANISIPSIPQKITNGWLVLYLNIILYYRSDARKGNAAFPVLIRDFCIDDLSVDLQITLKFDFVRMIHQ